MRRLLVADDDPHIGQARRICVSHHGVRVSAANGGPICPAPLQIIDASSDIQRRENLRLTINVRGRGPNHRASVDDATSSGGAASVNQDRLPDVAGRRYTPQLE
jgi:hypothetical protein